MKRLAIRLIVAALLSVLMLWLCNRIWDSPYTFGKGDNSIVAAALGRRMVSANAGVSDEIISVNTSYDRELVPVKDEFGIPIGEMDITDRTKLSILLDSLNQYGSYRYIVLDVVFDSSLQSEVDSSLFRLIDLTPRIILPKEASSLPDILKPKAASSGYKVFHHGEALLKYSYLSPNGEPSIPLRMWRELSGNDISRHWWGYSSGKRPCNNTAVLDFSWISGSQDTGSDDGGSKQVIEKDIYHLGADILSARCPEKLFRDKIVLIGDFFERDMHDTATGQVPGVIVLYTAYRALVEGRNRVPIFCYFILYFIFFIYCLIVFRGKGWNIRNRFFGFCLDWASFTAPLELFNFITLLLGGFSVNAVLIGTVFGVALYLRQHLIRS